MKHQIAATTLIVILIVCLGSSLIIVVSAAPGDLDTTFGGNGRILVGFGSAYDLGNALAMQTDGKIVVAAGTSNGSLGFCADLCAFGRATPVSQHRTISEVER
jgi:hypothetical protein